MLPLIAVPVLHSSGAWIASTAAGGYVAATLSSTWVGAFIAGNAGILTGLGITSAAGVLAAMGGGLSSVGAVLGSGLSAIGLTGVAQSLGLAPATFLGLTVASWALVATSVVAVGVGYFFTQKKLAEINQERAKGGLAAVTLTEIIAEVRDYEKQALMNILEELEAEYRGIIILNRVLETVVIRGKTYNVSNLKYVIEKTGREYLGQRSNMPFRKIVLFVVKKK
ncbi:hypothetical protein GCM10011352_05040 [Marinobacterium zhoushanense]|uniref:Uncharacterized protein n=1 Tax=Marinobacterium zhoushanense TaxID=1679163 RepID=A0ABQ1JZE4_9GAMM|nr:hypothetical protein [Marinobacterium zhoushanense]GGB82225.1 hypothetical protein GCM10011352_05040 [Marinobacterium zhoushanense]